MTCYKHNGNTVYLSHNNKFPHSLLKSASFSNYVVFYIVTYENHDGKMFPTTDNTLRSLERSMNSKKENESPVFSNKDSKAYYQREVINKNTPMFDVLNSLIAHTENTMDEEAALNIYIRKNRKKNYHIITVDSTESLLHLAEELKLKKRGPDAFNFCALYDRELTVYEDAKKNIIGFSLVKQKKERSNDATLEEITDSSLQKPNS